MATPSSHQKAMETAATPPFVDVAALQREGVAAGVEVITTPYDEIQKNGGGIHCSTMELVRERAG